MGEVVYRPKIRIHHREGEFVPELPGGETPAFGPHRVEADQTGAPPHRIDSVCSTLDHVIAAAGW